jgi:hypothetical protein
MKQLGLILAGSFLSVITFISCNNDENIPQGTKGRINVHLTDSPYPIGLIESAFVTIDKVEIRQKPESNQGEDDGSFIVISEVEMEIDLLKLTNGITEQIATVDLKAGTYDQIRLHVVDATVLLTDGTEFDLKVPSGSSSGLKIKFDPAIQIQEGQTTDVLLDFDVSRSFVVKGKFGKHINGFNFKPVVRGVFLGNAGRVEGNVSDITGNPLENAMVKLWVPGDEIEGDGEVEDETDNEKLQVSSFTDANGNYKLIGIPAGTYSVGCELEGFIGNNVTNVNVVSGKSVKLDFKLEKD